MYLIIYIKVKPNVYLGETNQHFIVWNTMI